MSDIKMGENMKTGEVINLSHSWKVHTPNLLKEIMCNDGAAILSKPLNIFGRILFDVAECASRINDAELNHLMCRLTLYEVADPDKPEYDKAILETVHAKSQTAEKKRLKL